MDIRPPVVAGQFYPGEKGDIINEIEYQLNSLNGRIEMDMADKKIIGGVSPHAGYIFSLPQAKKDPTMICEMNFCMCSL